MTKRQREHLKGLYQLYLKLDDEQGKLYTNMVEIPTEKMSEWKRLQERKLALLDEFTSILDI